MRRSRPHYARPHHAEDRPGEYRPLPAEVEGVLGKDVLDALQSLNQPIQAPGSPDSDTGDMMRRAGITRRIIQNVHRDVAAVLQRHFPAAELRCNPLLTVHTLFCLLQARSDGRDLLRDL